MQKLVQKAVFAALLVSSSAFANGDLLSQATDGAAVKTTEAKALSNDEMKDVIGGSNSRIYATAFTRYMTVTRYYTPMQRLSVFTRVNR